MARRFVAALAFGLALGIGLALGNIGRHWAAPVADQDAQQQQGIAGPPLGGDDTLTAERNLYPAPQTAILMADELGLDAEQRRRLHEVQQAADSEMLAIAHSIHREERRLDRAFADGMVDIRRLDSITGKIGLLQARLRATRLRAHLTTRDVLRPEQVLRYAERHGFEPSPQRAIDDLE